MSDHIKLKKKQTDLSSHDDLKRINSPTGARPLDVLMIGTGEYTTGYVDGSEPDSDKGAGVVALVCLDLKRHGKVKRLGLCGKRGWKLEHVMKHMKKRIEDEYCGFDVETIEMWPDTWVKR